MLMTTKEFIDEIARESGVVKRSKPCSRTSKNLRGSKTARTGTHEARQ